MHPREQDTLMRIHTHRCIVVVVVVFTQLFARRLVERAHSRLVCGRRCAFRVIYLAA